MKDDKYAGLTQKQLNLILTEQQSRMTLKLRLVITYSSLGLFAITVFSVLVMIFFLGLGTMSLPNNLVLALIGATIVQSATIFLGITRFLFPIR
jgi:hypothetical protein